LETRTKNYRTMTRQLEDVRAWTESRHDWLAHWANLHALFPPAGEAYITASGLQTSGAGAISFTVRARDAEVIDRLGDRLREAGYDYKTGRVATESDGPAMYPHSTEMKVFVKSDQEVPLAELTPAPRPADDMSAEVMHNPPRRNRRRR
jgi:hypothetical protein